MKRKDVQRLAAELVDGIEQLRRDLALRDAQVQQLTAEVERLRRLRDSDEEARLRDADETWLALAEARRLRAAMHRAAGLLSALEPYQHMHPETVLEFLQLEATQ